MSGFLKQILTKSIQICLQTPRALQPNHSYPFSGARQILQKAFYSNGATPYEVVDEKKQDKLVKEVINHVNTQVATGRQGRLFAVVHVAGKQFKITEGDVVVIEGYWPPECGDKISLDKQNVAKFPPSTKEFGKWAGGISKVPPSFYNMDFRLLHLATPQNIGGPVMVVGAADFTLIGRPLVQKGIVNVDATVIEKTLSHSKTNFKKKRRKQYKEINFYKIPQTYLRINTVQIVGEINNPPEVTGLETAVF